MTMDWLYLSLHPLHECFVHAAEKLPCSHSLQVGNGGACNDVGKRTHFPKSSLQPESCLLEALCFAFFLDGLVGGPSRP